MDKEQIIVLVLLMLAVLGIWKITAPRESGNQTVNCAYSYSTEQWDVYNCDNGMQMNRIPDQSGERI